MRIEFKRAVAALAVSKLMEGSYNEDSAASYVSAYLGRYIFPSKAGKDAAMALKTFRRRITAANARLSPVESISLARVHYDACLYDISGYGLPPKRSAQLLISALLVNIGKKQPVFRD